MKILKLTFLIFSCLITHPALALTDSEYKSAMGARDGCFLVRDVSSGKVVAEYNHQRCVERFAPCSSFKLAAALMAFEKKILKDENQIVKWDGVKRERDELNQDQTPYTWMKNSAMWVTQWITAQLGFEAIQGFLKDFSYGNQDFSGGLTRAWQTSSLKISAAEQVQFMTKLWKGDLGISSRNTDLAKKISFIKNLNNGSRSQLFGKTGTGCINKNCDKPPGGRMLGWFVGVVEGTKGQYAFAANATDLKTDSQDRPAGPRLRNKVVDLLTKLDLK